MNVVGRLSFRDGVPKLELGNQRKLAANKGSEFWRVHPNFKVIKKYNNSDKYAMAVHQLAQAIKQRYMTVADNRQSSSDTLTLLQK